MTRAPFAWADRDLFPNITGMLVYRKKAGYTIKEDARHLWEKILVWKVLKIIPRAIKYWVVIEVATKTEEGNPGEVTASTMLKRYEKKVV